MATPEEKENLKTAVKEAFNELLDELTSSIGKQFLKTIIALGIVAILVLAWKLGFLDKVI